MRTNVGSARSTPRRSRGLLTDARIVGPMRSAVDRTVRLGRDRATTGRKNMTTPDGQEPGQSPNVPDWSKPAAADPVWPQPEPPAPASPPAWQPPQSAPPAPP